MISPTLPSREQIVSWAAHAAKPTNDPIARLALSNLIAAFILAVERIEQLERRVNAIARPYLAPHDGEPR